jgi:Ca2+-binding EF-hand superfamily protein
MHLIRKLDTNKDGYVSYMELAEGLRDMGVKLFKGEQAAMMRRIDENRNGQISYDELLKALSRV